MVDGFPSECGEYDGGPVGGTSQDKLTSIYDEVGSLHRTHSALSRQEFPDGSFSFRCVACRQVVLTYQVMMSGGAVLRRVAVLDSTVEGREPCPGRVGRGQVASRG